MNILKYTSIVCICLSLLFSVDVAYSQIDLCNDVSDAATECLKFKKCPELRLIDKTSKDLQYCKGNVKGLYRCAKRNKCLDNNTTQTTKPKYSSGKYKSTVNTNNPSNRNFDMNSWRKNKLDELWNIFILPIENMRDYNKEGEYDKAIAITDNITSTKITSSINDVLISFEKLFKEKYGYEDEGWIVDEMHIYTIELRNTSIDFVQSLRDAYTYNDDGHSIGGIIDGAIRGLTSLDGLTVWWGESSFDKEERAINNAIKISQDAFIQSYNEFQRKLDDFVRVNYNDMLENK